MLPDELALLSSMTPAQLKMLEERERRAYAQGMRDGSLLDMRTAWAISGFGVILGLIVLVFG